MVSAGGKQALLPPVVCTPILTDIVYSATAGSLQHTQQPQFLNVMLRSQSAISQGTYLQSSRIRSYRCLVGPLWRCCFPLEISWIGSVVAATQSGTGHDAAAHAKENMEQGCKNESRPNCVSLEFQTHWISGSETILCNVMYNCTFPIRSEPTEGVNKMVKAVSSENNSFAVCYYWMVV